MTHDSPLPITIERLVGYLFDGAAGDPTAVELAGWLIGSAGFRAFVQTHRDKIRKKLRGAPDPEARRDVRAELLAARLLLADRRIGLAFEAYGSGKAGPDFTVTFRGERTFNVEVTRLRTLPTAAGLAATLLWKLRQLPPGTPNTLLVSVEAGGDALDVSATARALRARADAKDEAFFAGRGLAGTRGFYERFLRLGAVLVWCEAAAGDARTSLWTNPSARIAVPARALRACLVALQAPSLA